MRYTANCPGWSDRVGLFFHIFGHNSVNSLHLHILDRGPFPVLQYMNTPLDPFVDVKEM